MKKQTKQNDKNTPTTREYCRGVVECRICGFKYAPDLASDRKRHKRQHQRILAGAVPYDVREFMKRAAWNALADKHGPENQAANRDDEIAKRTIAFAWWARAVANGIPESEFEEYMTAHLAHLDATQSGNAEQLEASDAVSERWRKYGL